MKKLKLGRILDNSTISETFFCLTNLQIERILILSFLKFFLLDSLEFK